MSTERDLDETLRRTMSSLSAFVDTQWDPRVSLGSSPARLSGSRSVDRPQPVLAGSGISGSGRGEPSASSIRLDTSIEWRETLGEGGMGQVRLAVQSALGRTVAVKILRDDAGDEQAVRLLLREAAVTGAVEHPNVVPIYDVRVEDGVGPCVILKHIEGTTWDVLMHDPERLAREHGVSDALVWHLRVAIQICNAIGFAHSRGIVHRDIKPENVMIGAFGEVYVLDWGIARKVSLADSGREPEREEAPIPSSSGEPICGTPCYLAPEMLLPELGPIGPKTDVFLLGATLYELVSGAPPHRGKTLEEVLRDAILWEARAPGEIPDELAEIIKTCMQRNPSDRFESVAELRARLESFLSHLSSIRIADRALISVDRLEEVAQDAETPVDRQEAYRLFGGSRFGFSAALREWPENEVATDGLVRAMTAMVEIELRSGDARTAEAVVAPFDDPPRELLERIERAKRDQEERERAIRRDAERGRAHDPQTGKRTRRALGVMILFGWTLVPVGPAILGWLPDDNVLVPFVGVSLVSGAVILAFGFWARESLRASVLNKTAMATLLAVPLLQLTMCAVAYVAHWSDHRLFSSIIITWVSIALLITIFFFRWFALTAAAYVAVLITHETYPSYHWQVVALANGLTAVLVAIAWRGDVATETEERVKSMRGPRL